MDGDGKQERPWTLVEKYRGMLLPQCQGAPNGGA